MFDLGSVCLDGYDHYYKDRPIRQDHSVEPLPFDRSFSGKSLCKTHSISFYGRPHKSHWIEAVGPWFLCARFHGIGDKFRKDVSPGSRSILSLDLSICVG